MSSGSTRCFVLLGRLQRPQAVMESFHNAVKQRLLCWWNKTLFFLGGGFTNQTSRFQPPFFYLVFVNLPIPLDQTDRNAPTQTQDFYCWTWKMYFSLVCIFGSNTLETLGGRHAEKFSCSFLMFWDYALRVFCLHSVHNFFFISCVLKFCGFLSCNICLWSGNWLKGFMHQDLCSTRRVHIWSTQYLYVFNPQTFVSTCWR